MIKSLLSKSRTTERWVDRRSAGQNQFVNANVDRGTDETGHHSNGGCTSDYSSRRVHNMEGNRVEYTNSRDKQTRNDEMGFHYNSGRAMSRRSSRRNKGGNRAHYPGSRNNSQRAGHSVTKREQCRKHKQSRQRNELGSAVARGFEAARHGSHAASQHLHRSYTTAVPASFVSSPPTGPQSFDYNPRSGLERHTGVTQYQYYQPSPRVSRSGYNRMSPTYATGPPNACTSRPTQSFQSYGNDYPAVTKPQQQCNFSSRPFYASPKYQQFTNTVWSTRGVILSATSPTNYNPSTLSTPLKEEFKRQLLVSVRKEKIKTEYVDTVKAMMKEREDSSMLPSKEDCMFYDPMFPGYEPNRSIPIDAKATTEYDPARPGYNYL